MANRKLQGEIERVHKKVDEGVQTFEQIWDKVYSATTTAQKEKHEAELKKEIKKLQRLRDQIKTWQGDSSIKDKTKLDANRRLIEEKMEKFKVCEKETKTKAFSKEGLAQDRTDPKQRAKAEVGDWVREAIEKLKEQCEEMEAEIESHNSGKRKKRNDENPRVTQLKENIGRHEHHQEMLERVLRAVDNDAVTPEEATELKDSVDYYIESNSDPDFVEDDEMYDALNLEAAPVLSTGRKPAKQDQDDEEEVSSVSSPSQGQSKKAQSSPRNGKGSKPSTSAGNSTTKIVNPLAVSPKSGRSSDGHGVGTNSNSNNINHGVQTTTTLHTPVRSPRNASTQVSKESVGTPFVNGPLLSSVVKGTTNAKVNTRKLSSQALQNEFQSLQETNPTTGPVVTPTNPAAPNSSPTLAASSSGGLPLLDTGMFPPIPEIASSAAATTTATTRPMMAMDLSDKDVASVRAGGPLPGGKLEAIKPPSLLVPPSSSIIPESPIAAKSGVVETDGLDSVDLPAQPSRDSLSAEIATIDAALEFMPNFSVEVPQNITSDGENQTVSEGANAFAANNPSMHIPRNPASVPSSFPSVAAPVFDSRTVFERFDIDTLFFIFYYQQGTYQQFLAATELKRQGWRFHKKYLTWFQRHEEPTVSTDEYETGTFIYFDYANVVVQGQGSGWCQRIKSGFVFEYRYLEDELQ